MSKVEGFLPIDHNCKVCGVVFSISAETQKNFVEKGFELPTHCPDCLAKKHRIARFNCKDCGDPFEITELEGDSYESKGFPIPKRCPKCRKKRREASGK